MTQTWPFSGLWLAFLKQIPLSFPIFIWFRWSTNCLQELHKNLLQRKPGYPLKSSNPNIRQRWFNSCWKNTCLDARGTNKRTQQPRFSELQTAGYVVQTFKARELPLTTVKNVKSTQLFKPQQKQPRDPNKTFISVFYCYSWYQIFKSLIKGQPQWGLFHPTSSLLTHNCHAVLGSHTQSVTVRF